MAYVIQRCLRNDIYGRNATVRPFDPVFAVNFFVQEFGRQLDYTETLNPDPAGVGIANSLRAFIPHMAAGATILLATSIVGSRSALTSAYNLPANSIWMEQWLRNNAPKATLPVNSLLLLFWFS